MAHGPESAQSSGVRSVPLRYLGWLIASCLLVIFLWSSYPVLLHPRCAPLLVRSGRDVTISLPADCVQTAQVPSDNMTTYFENERNRRGLILKSWVVCQTPSRAPTREFTFTRDSRWLPSYVPDTYQFRRTVIILPYAQPVPEGSSVVAEVCLMPWRRYISQIAGECDGKFSVWK